MAAYVRAHLEMGCAGVVAMPNTKPPVSRLEGLGDATGWSIEQYLTMIKAAGGEAFQSIIVPLYLTVETTPEMIESGSAKGLLRACKYYPPHGTTNSEHGVPMSEWIGGEVFKKLEETGTVLCIHGEQHALPGESYLGSKTSAEAQFYRESMPRLLEAHPNLRVVCEHVTSKEAVAFVQSAGDRVAATVTPQHLIYTLGHLIQGLRYHLYCLPIVKFEEDRQALRQAVTASDQTQFFAGTDSAPHTQKATDCGCAAGCYVGGCAPQLYAMAFEAGGVDLATESGRTAFQRFLCDNGPAYYGLETRGDRFSLERAPGESRVLETEEGRIVPLPVGMDLELSWRLGD